MSARRGRGRTTAAAVVMAVSAAVGGYGAWQVWGTDAAAQADMAEAVRSYEASLAPSAAPAGTRGSEALRRPAEGVLSIPSLGLKVPVRQGTSPDVLARGAGVYAGSGAGKAGQAIAGHRTTHGAPFRQLGEMQRGDEIVDRGVRCRVVSTATVPATDAEADKVLGWAFAARDRLVLTTCHPEFSSRERLVVYAVCD